MVRSARDASKSVICLGVVPKEASPVMSSVLFLLALSSATIASISSGVFPSFALAMNFNFTSFGVPKSPKVAPNVVVGSANSHIPPTGSLKAPSPYTNTSTCLPYI